MDRAWMSPNRLTNEYGQRIHSFCNFVRLFAERNESEYVHFPYMRFCKVGELVNHLLLSSINPNYKVWRMHGEHEPQNDAPQVVSPQMDDFNIDWEDDDLIDMVNNVAEDSNVRLHVLETLRNDSELPLYEGYTKFIKLSSVLKSFNLKAKNSWSDKSFTELLQLVNEMLH
ncbi:unnamed protein product [Rhodiola kirilowii]